MLNAKIERKVYGTLNCTQITIRKKHYFFVRRCQLIHINTKDSKKYCSRGVNSERMIQITKSFVYNFTYELLFTTLHMI